MIILAASLALIFLKKRGKEYLKPFLLSVMTVPLSCLLMPFLPGRDITALAVELAAATAAITFMTMVIHKRTGADPFLLICLTTAAVICADLAAGSPMQKTSILGYDPIAGARFYGLGNEYMGILIGSVLIGTAAVIPPAAKSRRVFTAAMGIVYLFIIYLIAAPQLGTNVGGTIAAGSAFLVVFLLNWGVRFTWRSCLAAVLTVALVTLFFIVYDACRPSAYQSHVGRAAELIMAGGLTEVADIVARKIEMNIKLIKFTIWSRVFLASLGILALLFYRPTGVMQGIRDRHPFLYKGLVGVVAGSIVAFVFNDSGVVAAATTMIFGAPPLIYLVLEELEARNKEHAFQEAERL
jgi:hypothetical protein